MRTYKWDHAGLEPSDREPMVECPTCGLPAEVTDRFMLDGAPGPVEHVKIACVARHWYTLPTDWVPMGRPPASAPAGRVRAGDRGTSSVGTADASIGEPARCMWGRRLLSE